MAALFALSEAFFSESISVQEKRINIVFYLSSDKENNRRKLKNPSPELNQGAAHLCVPYTTPYNRLL